MLEVLIAVLVFSIGMIGLAGLLIFAISSNHVAYLRTQATFLAHNMANRMGANPSGVWNGDYNHDIGAAGAGITTTCAAGCGPSDLAKRDFEVWSQQLHTFLPNAQGSISCTTAGIPYSPSSTQIDMRPPYGGICTMTLRWNESGGAGGAQRASIDTTKLGQKLHTFEWVFQP